MMAIIETYTGFTMAKHDALVAKIKQQYGIDILDNGGTLTKNTVIGEVTLQYQYNATDETLILTCTKKPFIVSSEAVIGHMNELVND